MKIDDKSPCGACSKLDKCKVENKDKVRECGRFEMSELGKTVIELLEKGIIKDIRERS